MVVTRQRCLGRKAKAGPGLAWTGALWLRLWCGSFYGGRGRMVEEPSASATLRKQGCVGGAGKSSVALSSSQTSRWATWGSCYGPGGRGPVACRSWSPLPAPWSPGTDSPRGAVGRRWKSCLSVPAFGLGFNQEPKRACLSPVATRRWSWSLWGCAEGAGFLAGWWAQQVSLSPA